MFIPFLAATAIAATFAQLGAMSVRIAVLTLALKTMSIVFLALAIAAIAMVMRGRQQADSV